MKNIIYICIAALLVVGCSGKNKIPEGMIPKSEMVNILLDIHLMESKIEAARYLSRDSMQVAYFKAQADIFKKYKTDSTQYYKSYDYYFAQMFHMKDIYTEVAERMKAMSDSVAKIPASKQDSLLKNKRKLKDINDKNTVGKPKTVVPKSVELKPVKKLRVDDEKKK